MSLRRTRRMSLPCTSNQNRANCSTARHMSAMTAGMPPSRLASMPLSMRFISKMCFSQSPSLPVLSRPWGPASSITALLTSCSSSRSTSLARIDQVPPHLLLGRDVTQEGEQILDDAARHLDAFAAAEVLLQVLGGHHLHHAPGKGVIGVGLHDLQHVLGLQAHPFEHGRITEVAGGQHLVDLHGSRSSAPADNAGPWWTVIGWSKVILRLLPVRKNLRIRPFPIVGSRTHATRYDITIHQPKGPVNQGFPYNPVPNSLSSFFTQPAQFIHNLPCNFRELGNWRRCPILFIFETCPRKFPLVSVSEAQRFGFSKALPNQLEWWLSSPRLDNNIQTPKSIPLKMHIAQGDGIHQ
jgi:hypothetical protein